MDIDCLLSSHQAALMQADAAGSREAELAHLGRARCYADRARALRATLGPAPSSARRI